MRKFKIGETVLVKGDPSLWEVVNFSKNNYIIETEIKDCFYSLIVKEEDLKLYKAKKNWRKLWKI